MRGSRTSAAAPSDSDPHVRVAMSASCPDPAATRSQHRPTPVASGGGTATATVPVPRYPQRTIYHNALADAQRPFGLPRGFANRTGFICESASRPRRAHASAAATRHYMMIQRWPSRAGSDTATLQIIRSTCLNPRRVAAAPFRSIAYEPYSAIRHARGPSQPTLRVEALSTGTVACGAVSGTPGSSACVKSRCKARGAS